MSEAWKTRAASLNLRSQPSHSEETSTLHRAGQVDGSNAVDRFSDYACDCKRQNPTRGRGGANATRGGGLLR